MPRKLRAPSNPTRSRCSSTAALHGPTPRRTVSLHLGQFPEVRPAVDRRDLLFGETELKLRIHTVHSCRKVCLGKHPIDLDVQFHGHFLSSQNAQSLPAFPVILPQRPTLFKGTQAVIDASLLILARTYLARCFPG